MRELDVCIQSSQILRGIDVDVRDNEIVCLVGRNGAGKTTLLRTIMGYLRPVRGIIELDGRSLRDRRTYEIAAAGIGFSPEESEVFADLSVADNIELPTWTRKSARSGGERVELAYRIFPQLKGYMGRGGAQLSGGERKMLSIARALALDADMLLLDEPFEGLSPAVIPSISSAVHQIVHAGRSVLQAESSLHHVPEFAGRVFVIERGEIIFAGAPEEAWRDGDVKRIIGAEV